MTMTAGPPLRLASRVATSARGTATARTLTGTSSSRGVAARPAHSSRRRRPSRDDGCTIVKIGEFEITKRVGLGTNRLTKAPANVELIREAVAAGVQMIDTAHLYAGGQSEETIGAALHPLPDTCIVATKGAFGGAGRGRPEVLRAEIEESLRRLRTDVIQLYYLHRVDPETPIETSLGVIKEHVDRGTIRHVGVSEVRVEQIERARKVLPIVAVQNQYNLSERKYDDASTTASARGSCSCPSSPSVASARRRWRGWEGVTARRRGR
ncbi:MAG: aldo/keto reductase [Chloroflexi bacterium]|nr:MAG: aldo/keto reductase [Chloroflexota bacterium]